jgi:hypothetical protein
VLVVMRLLVIVAYGRFRDEVGGHQKNQCFVTAKATLGSQHTAAYRKPLLKSELWHSHVEGFALIQLLNDHLTFFFFRRCQDHFDFFQGSVKKRCGRLGLVWFVGLLRSALLFLFVLLVFRLCLLACACCCFACCLRAWFALPVSLVVSAVSPLLACCACFAFTTCLACLRCFCVLLYCLLLLLQSKTQTHTESQRCCMRQKHAQCCRARAHPWHSR